MRPSWAYCPNCDGHTKEVGTDPLTREAVYACDGFRPCNWRSDDALHPCNQDAKAEQPGLFGEAA